MPNEPDHFDEFLRRIDPLMQSPALYRSLEFACVAARTGSKCVLISGRATLSAEATLPGERIVKAADVDDLVALQGRLQAVTVNKLVANLRQGWVIDASDSEKVVLPSDEGSQFSWRQPGVFAGSEPRSRWKMSLTVFGQGPMFQQWLTNLAWDRVDNQLRRDTPGFSSFDALCESLALPPRRGQGTYVAFRISAELPAKFGRIQTDLAKGTLEIDIECLGSPELMVDWLPDHDFRRVPPAWKLGSAAERHHVSLTVPTSAKKANLILAFAELDAETTTADVAEGTRDPSAAQTRAASVPGGERWRPSGKSLGAGGQGQVSIVEDTLNEYQGRWVKKVLKRINDPKARERFGQEVKALQSLNHPNILKIIQSDLTAERPYFVAEYCEEGSLHESGATRYKGNMRAALGVLLPIIDALVAAHAAGVIHRDIKPANILFRRDRTAVVGDFGICYVEGSEGVTSLDEAVGPRHFIAPEMESGGRHVGEPTDKTDVYSLGKLLYWMLSGGLHFDRERHRANSLVQIFNDQRWEHVHRLLDRMVAEMPAERMSSSAARGELERVASLVEGDFAPLAPSVGIRCRFCGQGKYERFAAFDFNDPSVAKPYSFPNEGDTHKLGLLVTGGPQGTDVRVLRCSNCGHVEYFQFTGIGSHGWWDR